MDKKRYINNNQYNTTITCDYLRTLNSEFVPSSSSCLVLVLVVFDWSV